MVVVTFWTSCLVPYAPVNATPWTGFVCITQYILPCGYDIKNHLGGGCLFIGSTFETRQQLQGTRYYPDVGTTPHWTVPKDALEFTKA